MPAVQDTIDRVRKIDVDQYKYGFETLIEMTRKKAQADPATSRKEVTILDVYRNAAMVKVDAERWVDYLQVAKWNGEWKIVNVLWEMRPAPQPK